MIMARAPFRVSFAGGGSDLGDFYRHESGAVLSTSINKYMYVMIHPYFHDKIRIKYSKTEDVNSIDDIEHPIVRECLRMVGIEKGVEIASIADIPAGTGLGSSSTFTVCLLHALYAYRGKFVTKDELAAKACQIEINILKEPIGKQDQYAAAFGGLNYISFNTDESVYVEPLIASTDIVKGLEKKLMMFYLGNERKAADILTEQKKNMSDDKARKNVSVMVQMAQDMRSAIISGKSGQFAAFLHEGWLLKKKLSSNISNPRFDDYYDAAIKAGAEGGKVLGAGGGGFFLFYCEEKYQDKLRHALKLRELQFSFDKEGSKIIFID
jgi:D-glycero-alpha-D-manno-heptose-7-phosphate kinase